MYVEDVELVGGEVDVGVLVFENNIYGLDEFIPPAAPPYSVKYVIDKLLAVNNSIIDFKTATIVSSTKMIENMYNVVC